MPTLVIGNKLYSSWSLRPWLLLKQCGIASDEIVIPLDTPSTASEIAKHSKAGRVPILIDGDITVFESTAILEYVADAFGASIWPGGVKARAFARSISAEMHAGFTGLRSACPMNLGKKYARRDRGAAVDRDVARFSEIVRQARALADGSGTFLFGAFSGADAMFAPLATRLDTYSIALDPLTQSYVNTILALPTFQEWRQAAWKEPWIIEADEIDETPTEILRHAA